MAEIKLIVFVVFWKFPKNFILFRNLIKFLAFIYFFEKNKLTTL